MTLESSDLPNEGDFDDEGEDLGPAANRRDVRVRVMQALYAADISERVGECDIDLLASRIVGESLASRPDLLEFGRLLLMRTWNNRLECDTLINILAENWDFERITPIDKAILRMGIAEMLYFSEIPPRVTINEAIDIAKSFSTDKSGVFINGMLDAAVTRLKKDDKLQKSGRGLME